MVIRYNIILSCRTKLTWSAISLQGHEDNADLLRGLLCGLGDPRTVNMKLQVERHFIVHFSHPWLCELPQDEDLYFYLYLGALQILER